jgi:hypothetical protein
VAAHASHVAAHTTHMAATHASWAMGESGGRTGQAKRNQCHHGNCSLAHHCSPLNEITPNRYTPRERNYFARETA